MVKTTTNNIRPQEATLLPYFVTLGYSTIFMQGLVWGYDRAGMQGAFIASAVAYIPLGFIVGSAWSPNLKTASALAGIPVWGFIFSLHKWSVFETLTRITDGVPIILEPISVSLFFFVGAWLGRKASEFFTRKKNTSVSME